MSFEALHATHSRAAPPNRPPPRGSSRGRRWTRGLLASGAVGVAATVATVISGAMSARDAGAARTHTIARGDLLVTVTEQGTVESSRNTEIKCKVRGGYGGRGGDSTVTWVIPAGTVVQPGDELVRLDTKIIEETVSLGKTDTNIAKANLARAKADLARAEIAVDAYLKGRYRSQKQSLEKQLAIAQRNLRIAHTMLENSQELFEQGYVTELEVEGNEFTVRQAALELKIRETEIDVLTRLTKAMELETLNGQLIAVKSRLDGRKAGVALEQARLDLALEELGNCVIRAERGGLVIYPSTAKWKDEPDITEGASVHNNQVLLVMPDLSQLQVKVGIHESIIDRVKPGLAARVTLPDRTLDTSVSSVASVATPAGWWTGNEVNYDVIVPLPSVEGLNSGMSAAVEVVVARYVNILSVPVAAVVEADQRYFCWVETADGVQRRSLRLGDDNDEFIVVKAGLEEGDQVVLDPTATIAEARALVGTGPIHTVSRGDLIVTLTEQGTLESSENTKIKCEVRGNSTINWVIESGTQVKPGDVLVRLENKQIEDYLFERTKYVHLSRDAAIGFRAQATRAGLAISEYEEGRYRTELMTLQKDLAVAESNLRSARNILAHVEEMFARGYRSKLEIEEKTFAVERAILERDVTRTAIDVLTRFTKEEELIRLRGDWESAKAAASGHEEVLAMDEARVAHARAEIERCVIRAERGGLVIYPTAEEWKDAPDIAEGATVHHDQVLLLMPDLSAMQVKIGVHESMIDRIRPGLAAKVTLPDKALDGEITSVASVTGPAGWWTGNIVKYDTIIQLPSVAGLKPGMSAEVEVILARHDNVLRIPVAAVIETQAGPVCWIKTAEGAERRSLRLGDSNEVFMVVEEGLREGDQVVLNSRAFIEEAETREPEPGDDAKWLKAARTDIEYGD